MDLDVSYLICFVFFTLILLLSYFIFHFRFFTFVIVFFTDICLPCLWSLWACHTALLCPLSWEEKWAYQSISCDCTDSAMHWRHEQILIKMVRKMKVNLNWHTLGFPSTRSSKLYTGLSAIITFLLEILQGGHFSGITTLNGFWTLSDLSTTQQCWANNVEHHVHQLSLSGTSEAHS